MWASLFSLVELGLLCAGGIAWVHRPGDRSADSLALGSLVALIGLSFSFQSAFLLGVPWLSVPLEVAAAGGAILVLARRRVETREIVTSVAAVYRSAPLSCSVFAFGFMYLGVQAFFLPPHTSDALQYHLPRVLLFQQEGSLFPDHYTKYHQVAFPVGGDLLAHLFLRFHTDYGVTALQLAAYASMVAGVGALARRHASAPVALVTTLVIAGLPQLVAQSTVAKNNVYTAAAAVACLVLGERLAARPKARDLGLLSVAMAFGLSAKTHFGAFAAAYTVFFGALLIRAHGIATWRRLLGGEGLRWLPWIAVVAVVAPFWHFAANRALFGGWLGPAGFTAFHSNLDGAFGGVANLVRYLFQSVDLLEPTDRWVSTWTGVKPSAAWKAAYVACCEPIFGDAGVSRNSAFSVIWRPGAETAWFGPLGTLLVLPSLLYTGWRGRGTVRATAWTLLATLAVFSYAVAWFPWNARMLGLVYAASAPCVALILARADPGRRGTLLLRALAVAVLGYACWTAHPWGEWSGTRWGSDRLVAASKWLDPRLRHHATHRHPEGSEVAIVSGGNEAWPYFVLLHNPHARITLVRPFLRRRQVPGFDLDDALDSTVPPFDTIVCLTHEEGFCEPGRVYPGRARDPE